MIQRIKMLIVAVVLNTTAVFGLGTALVSAQTPATGVQTGTVACGSQGNITGTNCTTAGADDTVNNTIKRAIQIFQIIVGLISVFMLIFGGLKYITSGGESSGITGAKNTILYAVIGLVVVALAQVIVQFVLNRTTAPAGTI